MGRVRAAWMMWIVGAMFLAGCAEEPAPSAEAEGPASVEELDLEATEDTGVIRGVIVDPAIVPVSGVSILLDDGREAISSEDGGFGFELVEPGFRQLTVDAIGFQGVNVQVEVVAGEDRPDVTKIQLIPDLSELPYVEPLTFNGYIQCSGSTPAYRVAICAVPNTVTSILGQDPITEDEFIAGFEIGLYPDFYQAEMVWKSTQPAGDYLQLTAEVSPTDGEDIGSVSGVSPLVLQADNATMAAAGMDTSGFMQQRIFNMEHEATTPPVAVCDIPNPVHGGTMCLKGVGLTVDQTFQVFTHVFHRFVPDEGWLFIEDGAPRVP